MNLIILRNVVTDDLPTLFEHQMDEEANHIAAFTHKDPSDRDAYMAHWDKILNDSSITMKAILIEGSLAGSIGSHGWFGVPEVTYWIGREYWGRGVATAALTRMLEIVAERPLYARVAHDNTGSIRVLEKCGFKKHKKEKGFANARGEEVEEFIYLLK